MSGVAHCRDHAARIMKLPVEKWRDEIAKIPEGCDKPDCGEPKCCRQQNREYLTWLFKNRKPKGMV